MPLFAVLGVLRELRIRVGTASRHLQRRARRAIALAPPAAAFAPFTVHSQVRYPAHVRSTIQ